ncbi:epithelial membrane protein 3 [Coregonus clupeaformis]|uniref:Epithelial membrane protein 3 n=1 Tax=Coregonus suidteri TaxID=861788 RepID=A0AAN8L9C5_9TELE|nr:epithelial membrane protein 3 [Coregonus clupeaformis]
MRGKERTTRGETYRVVQKERPDSEEREIHKLRDLVQMAYLLMFVTLLHLITLAMLFIATMEKSWWVWDGMENSDLWYNCRFDNDTGTWLCASTKETEWLQSVQVLMVLSVVFSSVSFLVFLGQLFTMSKGGLFYFTGLCQVFAGLTAFAAALIYTLHNQEILQDSQELIKGHFGYCFILAWVCVPLLLISGVMYIHLRKKE